MSSIGGVLYLFLGVGSRYGPTARPTFIYLCVVSSHPKY